MPLSNLVRLRCLVFLLVVSHNGLLIEMRSLVRYPAVLQTIKGLVSAGPGKSLRYSAEKVGKWWRS